MFGVHIYALAELIFRFPDVPGETQRAVVISPSSSSYKDNRGMISVITKTRCPYHA